MVLRLRKPLPDEEIARLVHELSISNSAKGIKRAVQDLCTHYEAGRFLRDTTEVRQLLHGHLWSEDVLIRRWSLKALGIIANPEDAHRVLDRLRTEEDVEAITWGAAALFGSSGERTVEEILDLTGLDNRKALLLAARLYAPKAWLDKNPIDLRISLNDDPVTLKWSAFLTGYNKAPEDLFSPKYTNDLFLGELNNHDTPEVAEYSVWALWQRDDYDPSYLRVPIAEVYSKPENMRKWLYRLMSKSHTSSGLDVDAVRSFRMKDTSNAIEGLALGIVDVNTGVFDEEVLDWFLASRDGPTRDVLLTGMARRSDDHDMMQEVVLSEFEKAPIGSKLRRHLLAASVGTSLRRQLGVIEAREQLARQGILDFADFPAKLVVNNYGGNNTMSTFNAGRDINAQNMVGGSMIASANNAVQSLGADRSGDQEVLSKVLEFLKSAPGTEAEKAEVYATIDAVAKDPSKEKKNKLLESVKRLGGGVAAVGAAAGGYADLITTLTGFVG